MNNNGPLKYIFQPGLIAAGLAVFSCLVIAQTIVGSAHDFSDEGWSGGEICLPCHTPHNADTTEPDAPLWNHAVTASVFTVYTSPTMEQTPVQPQGPTKLCLSCHDGTVALDSFGGTTGTNFIAAAADLTTDLSDDHPVSVYWNHQTGGAGSGPYCNNCHAAHNPTLQLSVLPFFNHYVECSTCHNVHNSSGNAHLLRLPLTGSTLCLYCHRK